MHPEYEPWPEAPLTLQGELIWHISKLVTLGGLAEAALHYDTSNYKGVCIALLGVGISATASQLNHEWNRQKNT